MSHNIESIAWTNTVPWHGLGDKVDDSLSSQQMLTAAKLDWTVSRRPLFHADRPGIAATYFNGFSALVRDSDESVLDVVGSRYLPTQNADAFEFFTEFVHAGKAKMDTAGSLRGGRIVWGLASLGAGFTLAGKDRVNGYLLLALPHEQGKSIQAKFTSIRVVCNNTLTAALGGKGQFRMSHRTLFDAKAQETAKVTLGIAREQVQEQEAVARKLCAMKMGAGDARVFLTQMIDPELFAEGVQAIDDAFGRGDVSKKLAIADAALTKSPGAKMLSADGTAWGVLNAVTYAVDHAFGRGADQRMSKAWFGNGAALKQKAYDQLARMAG